MNHSYSEKLFQRAQECIPGGVNSPVRAFRSVGGNPFFTRSAEGACLTTEDDHVLIDYVCTWGPAIHGHHFKPIFNAVADALARGTSFGTPVASEVHMAEKIIKHVPSAEKVRLVNSGTEATMTAIRVARGYTGRSKIIKFSGCYHGHVDGLLVKAGSGALTTGQPDSAGVPESYASETILLPFNDIPSVQEAFEQQGEEIACVIVEPYPANCGLIIPDTNYLQQLQNCCAQHGAVLIFDEVMTGFRVSMGGVQERTGITPDLSALGKIIGGGLPVGAVAGRQAIMDVLSPEGPVYQAGTLAGNPLSMAAGIASIEALETRQPHQRLEQNCAELAEALLAAAKEKGLPLQVPHTTGMFCLYFSERPVQNVEDAKASKTDYFSKVFRHALEEGVYLPPSAFETCFMSTAHTPEHLSKTIEVVANAIKKL